MCGLATQSVVLKASSIVDSGNLSRRASVAKPCLMTPLGIIGAKFA